MSPTPTGHKVRTQHAASTSEENRQRRGDVEILNYLQDAAGARNLVFDLAVTPDTDMAAQRSPTRIAC